MFISFSDIPGYKNLMLDFIYEFEKVEKYGLKNFKDIDVIEKHLDEVAGLEIPHRAKLVEIIKNQYEGLNAVSQKTRKNINALLSNKTLAIIGAQQIGLFGGPLQYFYKILSIIKLTEKFNDIFEQYNFVPVFWLESEDHDFENAHKIYTYNYDKAVRKIAYDDGLPEEENRGSVGEIIFDKNLRGSFSELKKTLKKTAYTDELFDLLRSTFQEGISFKAAFKNLLFELFDKYGLIIFDGSAKEAKILAKRLFAESIENYEELAILGIESSAKLEEEYHAHVKIHPVNLFYLDAEKRRRIEPHEKGFKFGAKRKIYSRNELLELIDEFPERFSPNVILRPLMQDSIFPAAVIIAGENEMNYFPQIIPYYKYFNITTPLLYPRASVTLNENYLAKKIEAYNVKTEHLFFLDKKELARKIIYAKHNLNLEKIFAETAADIDLSMETLIEKLTALDPKLETAATEVKQGIAKLLEILNDKAHASFDARQQNILRHVKTLKNQFAPHGKPQENVINFAYFANHYGVGFLDQVYNEISLSAFMHQIITI